MANSLASLHTDYWARKVQNSLYGFNTDPRTNRVDEYARFNRIREELYAKEDYRYRRTMRALAIILGLVLLSVPFVL